MPPLTRPWRRRWRSPSARRTSSSSPAIRKELTWTVTTSVRSRAATEGAPTQEPNVPAEEYPGDPHPGGAEPAETLLERRPTGHERTSGPFEARSPRLEPAAEPFGPGRGPSPASGLLRQGTTRSSSIDARASESNSTVTDSVTHPLEITYESRYPSRSANVGYVAYYKHVWQPGKQGTRETLQCS